MTVSGTFVAWASSPWPVNRLRDHAIMGKLPLPRKDLLCQQILSLFWDIFVFDLILQVGSFTAQISLTCR
jgi:hypothetical protein